MAKGRHEPRRRFGALAIALIAGGVIVLLAGGASLAAYRYDQANANRIMPGVRVAGVDVGGMTKREAIRAVRATATDTLGATLRVQAGGERWTVTPAELGRRASVVAAVNRAVQISEGYGFLDRVWKRLRDDPVDREIRLNYHGGEKGAASLVDQIADEVAVEPQDASINLDGDKLVFVRDHAGRALALERAESLLDGAVQDGASSVALPLKRVDAAVTAATLGSTIVVHVDQNRLDLYNGFEVQQSWPVATAKPGYTTPAGEWTMYDKAMNPTWYNPALDSWGAGLPAVVPGGPGNPMGTRALYITAPGLIRIHGTTDDSSIGRYASHGCIRMHNSDVERLYDLVPVGTEVLVVGQRPAGAQEWDTPASADI